MGRPCRNTKAPDGIHTLDRWPMAIQREHAISLGHGGVGGAGTLL